MILICPQCNSRCEVANSALRRGRRNVRCLGCGHVWSAGARRYTAIRAAVIAAAVAGLVGGALYARNEIARFLPPTAGLYAALGAPVNLRGLEFRNITTETTIENGISVLSVRGDIVNVTSRSVGIPPIRFSMRDGGQVEIYHWTGEADAKEIAPAGQATFATLLAAPPIAGEQLEIRFDGSAAKEATGNL